MAPFFEAIVDLQITLFADGVHERQPDSRRCPFLVVMIFVALLAIERLENSVGIEWLLSVVADGEIVGATRDNEVSTDFVVEKSVFQQIGEHHSRQSRVDEAHKRRFGVDFDLDLPTSIDDLQFGQDFFGQFHEVNALRVVELAVFNLAEHQQRTV